MTEILFGGARGGGKTDGVLGKWALKAQTYGEYFNATMFRKKTTASVDAIERSKQIYYPIGGHFVASPRPVWRLPGGGRVSFDYLNNTTDAENQQGRNLTDAWVEEVGQYATPEPIDMLYGALRSLNIPIQLILTGNPGGPGQAWISKRYKLIPLPQRPQLITRKLPDGTTHQMAVIPSRITDNKLLMHNDPGYKSRLQLTGSAQLVKAWLEGDWNAIEGAFFDCWSSKMVIKPFKIPAHWTRFRSYDWGTASPFSAGWWAVSDGKTVNPATGEPFPEGALIRYREWYGADPKAHNKGLKLTNKQQARGILDMEAKGEKISYSVADPSIFGDRGGPTIAEDMGAEGVYYIPGQNNRQQGWQQLRLRMFGVCGMPMIYVFDTCVDSIRTIPILPHSLREPEDLDTDAEDHIADEWRYACMTRPWVTTEAQAPKKRDRYDRLFEDQGSSTSWR